MLIAKQMEIRSDIKKYFDMAYDGETVIVPRKQNRNVVIISETEYSRLCSLDRLSAYSSSVRTLSEQGKLLEQGKLSEYGKETKKNDKETKKNDVRSDNLRKLEVIRGLKDGWNGNGAPCLSEELVSRVSEIIKGLDIQPEIFPTALGTIQLEFDNSRRDHMEMEISDDDMAEVFIVLYNGEEYFEQIPVSGKSISMKVRDFYG